MNWVETIVQFSIPLTNVKFFFPGKEKFPRRDPICQSWHLQFCRKEQTSLKRNLWKFQKRNSNEKRFSGNPFAILISSAATARPRSFARIRCKVISGNTSNNNNSLLLQGDLFWILFHFNYKMVLIFKVFITSSMFKQIDNMNVMKYFLLKLSKWGPIL